MARAKQTNRAEARRRHRQMLAESGAPGESRDESEPSPGGSDAGSRGGGAGRPGAAGSGGRPSLGAAFREAYHPAHYGEDLRALPGLITLTQPTRIPLTRTVVGVPWFLVSAFLVIAGFVGLLISAPSAASVIPGASPSPTAAVATAAPTASTSASVIPSAGPTASSAAGSPVASAPAETPGASASPAPSTPGSSGSAIGALLFQLLSLPPGGPTLPILLVGFMATRASYLQGFLIGLLDLVLIGLYVAFAPSAQGSNVGDILLSAAATGLPTSVLFAAAAAWYRRFLALSSPRRAAPPRGGGRGRPSGRPTTRR